MIDQANKILSLICIGAFGAIGITYLMLGDTTGAIGHLIASVMAFNWWAAQWQPNESSKDMAADRPGHSR